MLVCGMDGHTGDSMNLSGYQENERNEVEGSPFAVLPTRPWAIPNQTV